MFCPGCAEQNADDAKYCRACREDLTVISQAMQRRLPVILASKLDEYLERTNERLRRDSIVAFLFAILSLAFVIWNAPWGMWLIMASGFFSLGLWEMLAYKRSVSQLSGAAQPSSAPAAIYCPRCAEPNSNDARFCRQCGQNLQVISRAMTRRLPAFLTDRLDRYLEYKNERIHKDIFAHAFGGIAFLLMGILELSENKIWPAAFFIGLGGAAFVSSVWDLLIYKRISSSAARPEKTTAARATDELESPDFIQLSPPPSVTEATTKIFEEPAERSTKG